MRPLRTPSARSAAVVGQSMAIAFAVMASVTMHEARAVDGAVAVRLSLEPPLRARIEGIRARVVDNHTLITHRRLSPAAARSFAGAVKDDVDAVRVAVPAGSSATAALVPLLDAMVKGADAVGQGGSAESQIDGLVLMVDALERYAVAFDHPGWKPLASR